MADKLEIISIPEGTVIAPGRGKVTQERTWSALINKVTNMTVSEAAEYFGKLAENKDYPQGITLREVMIARAIQDFMEKPNPAIWNAIMDRSEGKVAESMNVHQVTEVEIKISRVDDTPIIDVDGTDS